MRLSVYGYIVLATIAGALICAFAGAAYAFRQRSLFVEDFGTLFLVPPLFFFLGMLREELRTGWAVILWPIIIAVICMYAFSSKVAFVDPVTRTPHLNSRILLLTCLIGVTALALTVPPWYE